MKFTYSILCLILIAACGAASTKATAQANSEALEIGKKFIMQHGNVIECPDSYLFISWRDGYWVQTHDKNVSFVADSSIDPDDPANKANKLQWKGYVSLIYKGLIRSAYSISPLDDRNWHNSKPPGSGNYSGTTPVSLILQNGKWKINGNDFTEDYPAKRPSCNDPQIIKK